MLSKANITRHVLGLAALSSLTMAQADVTAYCDTMGHLAGFTVRSITEDTCGRYVFGSEVSACHGPNTTYVGVVDSCASGVAFYYFEPFPLNGNGIIQLFSKGFIPDIYAAEVVLAQGTPVGALMFFDNETNELKACYNWQKKRADGRYTTEERGSKPADGPAETTPSHLNAGAAAHEDRYQLDRPKLLDRPSRST